MSNKWISSIFLTLTCLSGCAYSAGNLRMDGSEKPVIALEFRLAETTPKEGLTEATIPESAKTVYLHSDVILDNNYVQDAYVVTGNWGRPAIEIKLIEQGRLRFRELTGNNRHKLVAIFLDGKLIIAPMILERIDSGRIMIAGNFTKQEAKRIAKGILTYQPIPVNQDKPEDASWMPLGEGNYWEYAETNGGEVKILVSGLTNFNGIQTWEVQRIATAGLFEDSGAYQADYLKETDDGILLYGKSALNNDYIYKKPVYLLKYPLTIGKKWENKISYDRKGVEYKSKRSMEVISVEQVSTPAGDFDSVKIKISFEFPLIGQLEYLQWYVEGVGMVKEVFQSKNTIKEKVLTSYKIDNIIKTSDQLKKEEWTGDKIKDEKDDEWISEEEWEEIVGPLKDLLDVDRIDVPYVKLLEITEVEWRDLIKAVKEAEMGNAEANIYMWGFLYKLDKWYVVQLESKDEWWDTRPFAGSVNGVPSLMLFTSKKLALQFAEKNQLTEHQSGYSISDYQVPEDLEYLQSFESQGVRMVRFNDKHPVGGWKGPINLLTTGYEWHLKNDERFQ